MRNVELIINIQNGDDVSRERFYLSNYDELVILSTRYARKYSKIDADSNNYLSIVYDSCEKAIRVFKSELGDFDHLFMRILRREVLRHIDEVSKRNSVSFSLDSVTNEFRDKLMIDCCDSDDRSYDGEKSLYDKSIVNEILDYVKSKHNNRDNKIFSLWLKGYKFCEIAETLNIRLSNASARIYTIIDELKERYKD